MSLRADRKASAFTITAKPEATKAINNRATIPTTSGQIGVNPVEDELGDDNQRGVIQHADTQYITTEGSTTKWIGVNTEYLSLDTINPTSTSTVQIAVATATEAAGNQAAGDLSVIIPAGLAKALSDAANDAVTACNALSTKLRKRDAASVSQCLLNKASSASQDGGIFDVITTANWESYEVALAKDAPELLAAAWQVLKTKVIRNRFALLMGAIKGVLIAGSIAEAVPIGKYIFSKTGFGSPPPNSGGGNNGKGCTGQEKKNKDSPLCEDDDCKGINSKCTVDPNKNCPCLDVLKDPEGQWYDQSELDAQQSFFASINTAKPAPPKTYQQADPTTVNGPTSTSCTSGTATLAADFELKVPKDKDALKVDLPIIKSPGSYKVTFKDDPSPITFWQVDAGKPPTIPITNDNKAPSKDGISWTLKDNDATDQSRLSFFFDNNNKDLDIHASFSGSAKCSRPHPADNPGHNDDSAKAIDAWSELGSGPAGSGQKVQPRDLFYRFREMLCNNKCEKAADIDPAVQLATKSGDGCEIAAGMSRGVEIYAYRATASTGPQWQDCWDSLASIIDNVIKNGPNSGWVNGPDPYEYFEAGVRNNDAQRPSWSHQGPLPSQFIRPSFLLCGDQSCNGPKHGAGTCDGKSQHPGLMCCNNDLSKCDGSQDCSPSGGQCTGKQNGCLCTFNGPKARGLPAFAGMRDAVF